MTDFDEKQKKKQPTGKNLRKAVKSVNPPKPERESAKSYPQPDGMTAPDRTQTDDGIPGKITSAGSDSAGDVAGSRELPPIDEISATADEFAGIYETDESNAPAPLEETVEFVKIPPQSGEPPAGSGGAARIWLILRGNLHWLLYGVFCGIQVFNHCFVILFGDDYYYAAFWGRGFQYMLEQNVYHYKYTNGRAMVHLLDELLIGINFNLWRAFNIIVIAALVLVIAAIGAGMYRRGSSVKSREFKIALVCSVCLFSVLDIRVIAQSVYWATGAMNYLFSPVLALIFYYIYRYDAERNAGYKWMPAAAFFASLTVEQSSAVSFLITLLILISCPLIYRRRPRRVYYINALASAAGLATVILAPGNDARTNYYPEFYSLGFLGKLGYRLRDFTYELISRWGMFFVFVILLLIAFCLCTQYSEKIRRVSSGDNQRKKPPQKQPSVKPLIIKTGIYITAGMTLIGTAVYTYCVIYDRPKTDGFWYLCILCVIPLCLVLADSVIRFFKKEDTDSAPMLLLAAAMQCVMLISPEFGPRTFLISALLCFIPIIKYILRLSGSGVLLVILTGGAIALCSIVEVFVVAAVIVVGFLCLNMRRGSAGFICACVCAVLSLSNLLSVGLGYAENHKSNRYNEERLRDYLESGDPPALIEFAYPKNFVYRYTLPFDNPYHMARFKELYSIPHEVEIIYQFYDDLMARTDSDQ